VSYVAKRSWPVRAESLFPTKHFISEEIKGVA
jgi:hypothetical protein